MAPRENAQALLSAKVARTAGKHSPFEVAVRNLPIPVCSVFFDADRRLAPTAFQETDIVVTGSNHEESLKVFPLTIARSRNAVLEAIPGDASRRPIGKRVAVLFSGGPAPGGHNVLAGLKAILGPGNILLGARRGTKGLFSGDLVEITAADARAIVNTGGFDFLGTDRTKVKTPDQFASVKETILKYRLDGLVVVGGDDSNTNAAFIAEYLLRERVECGVVGVPKTIDGDLAIGALLPTSFGFDTATKVYAQLAGNLNKDSASAVKYWHFVKLMGRTASKITLEVALQTKPAAALISEEIYEKGISLDQVVHHLIQGNAFFVYLFGDQSGGRFGLEGHFEGDLAGGSAHQLDKMPVFDGRSRIFVEVPSQLGIDFGGGIKTEGSRQQSADGQVAVNGFGDPHDTAFDPLSQQVFGDESGVSVGIIPSDDHQTVQAVFQDSLLDTGKLIRGLHLGAVGTEKIKSPRVDDGTRVGSSDFHQIAAKETLGAASGPQQDVARPKDSLEPCQDVVPPRGRPTGKQHRHPLAVRPPGRIPGDGFQYGVPAARNGERKNLERLFVIAAGDHDVGFLEGRRGKPAVGIKEHRTNRDGQVPHRNFKRGVFPCGPGYLG